MGKWELWTDEIKDAPPIPKVTHFVVIVWSSFLCYSPLRSLLKCTPSECCTKSNSYDAKIFYACTFFLGDDVQWDYSSNCGYSQIHIPYESTCFTSKTVSFCWANWYWKVRLHHGTSYLVYVAVRPSMKLTSYVFFFVLELFTQQSFQR